jgi:hypothetical protein
MVDVLCCALGSVIFLSMFSDEDKETYRLLASTRASDLQSLKKVLAEVNKKNATLNAENKSLKDDAKDESELAERRRKEIAELLAELTKMTKNEETAEKLLAARLKEIKELNERLGGLLSENTSLKADKVKLTAEKQKKIDDLLAQLSWLADKKEFIEMVLAQRNKEMDALLDKLALLGKNKSTLEADLQGSKAETTKRQLRIDELAKQAEELTRKLLAAEANIKQLEKTARLLPKLQDELKEYRTKLTDEEVTKKLLEGNLARRAEELAKAAKDFETLALAKKALEKKLEGVSRELIEALANKERLTAAEKKRDDLQELVGKKSKDLEAALDLLAKLKGDSARLKALIEHRFAGIALTGKKVIFIVDTSGSMDLVDEKTPAPNKWPGVCDTVAQVMRSLTDLEKFQIITFSEEVKWVLGKDGEWLDFNVKTTPDQVREALIRMKPSGGTNLHAAFKATFDLRAKGLDTVYLFSDGLPNEGEGLTAEQDRTIKDENARSGILSKHLRKKLKEEWNRPIEGQDRVRINAIGFFFESPDVGAFLWALAREHDGSFVGMSKP